MAFAADGKSAEDPLPRARIDRAAIDIRQSVELLVGELAGRTDQPKDLLAVPLAQIVPSWVA